MSILFDSRGLFSLKHANPKSQNFSNLPCYRKEFYAYEPLIEALIRLDSSAPIAREYFEDKNCMSNKGASLLILRPSSLNKRGRYNQDDARKLRDDSILCLEKQREPKSDNGFRTTNTLELENNSPLKKTKIIVGSRNENMAQTVKLKIANETVNENTNEKLLLPKMDSKETASQYQILISLPGASKEKIKIDFIKGKNKLIVSGKLQRALEDMNESSNINQNGFFLNEITNFGEFKRIIQFENNIATDSDSIKAVFENGILYIILNKQNNQKQTAVERMAADPEVLEILAQKPQEDSVTEEVSGTENVSQPLGKLHEKIHKSNSQLDSTKMPKVRRITVEFD